MSPELKLTLSAIGRLATAGAATYAAAALTGDFNLGVALATVASSYLVNRANALEEQAIQPIPALQDHHLQLALAGAFRIALDELRPGNAAYASAFDAWQTMLDAALDQPTTLLPVIIPARLLDATNPQIGHDATFEDVELLLRSWLAYQQDFERNSRHSSISPSALPKLPTALSESLREKLLPAFPNSLREPSGFERRRIRAPGFRAPLFAGTRWDQPQECQDLGSPGPTTSHPACTVASYRTSRKEPRSRNSPR